MSKKDKLIALKKEAKDFAEKANTANSEDAKKLEDYKSRIDALQAEIKADEAKTALLTQIGKKEEVNEMGEVKAASTIGEHFVNNVKASQHGKKFSITAPAFTKAATDVQTSPAAAVDWATTFDRNVVTAPRTPLVIRDLFGAETISGSTLQYLVEGAIQGAPAVTAEGGEKPQVHFADPTPVTVALKKIACHIREADEYIDDYPFLASAINGRLLYELGLVEQNTLVTDLLGTTGIQTGNYAANATATDIAEAILRAAMDVQLGSGFAADAIALNPADWYKLRVAKASGTGEYFGGGFFGAQNIPNLWGIPVCVTTAVAADTIIIGAFKTCGSVVQKGGVSVEATNTNEDDFVKNLMTIRAEERLALAIRRPAGFKKLTKSA